MNDSQNSVPSIWYYFNSIDTVLPYSYLIVHVCFYSIGSVLLHSTINILCMFKYHYI